MRRARLHHSRRRHNRSRTLKRANISLIVRDEVDRTTTDPVWPGRTWGKRRGHWFVKKCAWQFYLTGAFTTQRRHNGVLP